MLSRLAIVPVALLSAVAVPARLGPGRIAFTHLDATRAPVVVTPFRADRDLAYYLAIKVSPEKRKEALAEAKRANAFAAKNQFQAAVASYDRAASLAPSLADWLQVFAAGAAASAGDTAQVNKRLSEQDSLIATDWGWRTRVRAYRNANDRGTALQLAEYAAQTDGSARRRAEAWLAIGDIRLQQGDTAAARSAFATAMDAWPYSDPALEAARLLIALPSLSADENLRIGRLYLRYGNTTRGFSALRQYLDSRAADPDTAARVRLEIGRAQFAQSDYRGAEQELLTLAERTPNSQFTPDALFLVGRAQYRQGRQDAAQETLQRIARTYPDHDMAARAYFLLGDLRQDEADFEGAAELFRQATQASPQTEAAGIARMRLGVMSLADGDAGAAAREFEEYRTQFTQGARNQQATYWAGVAHLQLGSTELGRSRLREARDLDPFSFYGIRAGERLDEAVMLERLQPSPVTTPEQKQAVNAAVTRLDFLRDLEWNEAAAFEQERVNRYFANELGARYELAEQYGRTNRLAISVTLGRELLRRGAGWDERLLRILYPFPYRDLITREARKYGISPYLAAALIRQESAFNPVATSSAGAIGLMQVMPSTGRRLARVLGIRSFRTASLRSPEMNVRIGTRFLADMIKAWDGRADKVLAAYNAGPNRMERWAQFPEAREAELFMERIPFDETRDYVRVVQLNARIYQMLYGSGRSASATSN